MFSSPELTYEADVPYYLRYMLDNEVSMTYSLRCLRVQSMHQILALSWLKIPAKEYDVIEPSACISHCQMEVSVEFVGFYIL